MNILFLSKAERAAAWLELLRAALPRERILTPDDGADPASIEVALVAIPPAGTLAALPNLALVQSLWMGVDALLADPTFPRAVPLARMVDPSVVAAMSETVLACVLDHHRLRHVYRAQQGRREWKPLPQHRADERTVGLVGLGELGRDAAAKLVALGFRVMGWSRGPKALPAVECVAGREGLHALLARCDVVACLLPLTRDTRGLLNAEAFGRMRPGSGVANLARGGHVVEADLLAALDSGHLGHAWLDVFDTEPLPAGHAFWTHPRVTLTPHVAALSDPRTCVPIVVENLGRLRRGEPLLYRVDPAAGY